MSPFLFADNFLAGSLLTLLLPTGLLIAIAIWFILSIKRVPQDTPTSPAALPSSDVLAAADADAQDIQAIPPAGDD